MRKINALFLVFCIVGLIVISSSCGASKGVTSTTKETIAELTILDSYERKEIAIKAVVKYIYQQMSQYANTGKYSIIDYRKMKYTASAILKYDDLFTVEIEIYHYD